MKYSPWSLILYQHIELRHLTSSLRLLYLYLIFPLEILLFRKYEGSTNIDGFDPP